MLLSSIRNVVAAAIASTSLFATISLASVQEGQSTFISPRNELAFGFTIPNDTDTKNTDIYFTIAAVSRLSWAAIGLGSHTMEKALVLMVYASADLKAVTISPRVSKGWYEPGHEPKVDIEQLESKIENGTFVYSGRCTNCRNWSNGYLDVTSETVPGIYALGPDGDLATDEGDADIKYHYAYGAFTVDLRHATGPAGAPVVNMDTTMFGAELYGDDNESGKKDWKSKLHAIAMVFTFVGLMPFGVVILRIASSVRWHWINQSLALFGVIIGAGLGIYDSFYYQRTRKFNTAHQILGLFVLVFVLGQYTLGFLHHRIYKRTQQTTKMAPIHVWLGRVILILAIVTAFLGFPLALSPKRNYILIGLVVAVTLGVTFLFFSRGLMGKLFGGKNNGHGGGGVNNGDDMHRGYDPEPWRQAPPPAYGSAPGTGSSPYRDDGSGNGLGYAGAGSQSVGLTDMGGSGGGGDMGVARGTALGSEQKPSEYV